MRLWLDTETFSSTPIKYGTYRYVDDSELMISTWAIEHDAPQAWDRTLDPRIPGDVDSV